MRRMKTHHRHERAAYRQEDLAGCIIGVQHDMWRGEGQQLWLWLLGWCGRGLALEGRGGLYASGDGRGIGELSKAGGGTDDRVGAYAGTILVLSGRLRWRERGGGDDGEDHMVQSINRIEGAMGYVGQRGRAAEKRTSEWMLLWWSGGEKERRRRRRKEEEHALVGLETRSLWTGQDPNGNGARRA